MYTLLLPTRSTIMQPSTTCVSSWLVNRQSYQGQPLIGKKFSFFAGVKPITDYIFLTGTLRIYRNTCSYSANLEIQN